MRRAVIATAVLSLTASFVTACQLIAGIDVLPIGDDASSGDGAADVVPMEAASGADACAFMCSGPTLPARPSGAATADTGSFVVALSALRLGFMPDGGAPASLDLDCTVSDGGAGTGACTPHQGGTTPADDPGGGDNGLYQVFSTAKGVDFMSMLAPQQFIDNGLTTVLLKVVEYNGQTDDPQVSVLAFYSGGHFPDDAYDEAGTFDAASPYAPPAWGSPPPRWTVDPASAIVASGSVSALRASTDAYVSGGVLVASFTSLFVPLVGPNDGDPIGGQGTATSALVYVDATSAVLTARISTDGAGTSLYDGHVVGSLSTKNALSALGPFSDLGVIDASLHDERFCNNPKTGTYPLLKQAFCSNADLATARNNAPSGQCATVCDGISFAYGFTALPAALGGAATFPVANGKKCANSSDPMQNFNCCEEAGVDAAWVDECAPDWQ